MSDSQVIERSLRAIRINDGSSRNEIDRVLTMLDAETGKPLQVLEHDPRALVHKARSVAFYLYDNRRAVPAFDLESAGLVMVEVVGNRVPEGLPTNGPRITDDPTEYNERVLHSLAPFLRASGRHGQTTVELPQPWRERVQRYVLRRPSGLRIGPDAQLAEGVTLKTRGFLVLPTSLARIDGMPVRFAVPLDAEEVTPGGWNYHMQIRDPDSYRSLLVELPAAIVELASKFSKRKAA